MPVAPKRRTRISFIRTCHRTPTVAHALGVLRSQSCERVPLRSHPCWIIDPMAATQRQFQLVARPEGLPKESDFNLVEAPLPAPQQGEVIVQTLYLSVDPYMRGRVTGVRTYADPVNIGDVMVGGAVGQVIESRDPSLQPGDFVAGYWGWRDRALSPAAFLTTAKSYISFGAVTRAFACFTGSTIRAPHSYLLQPFLVSSNPSNKRPALAPASVSIRCGWPFSTV